MSDVPDITKSGYLESSYLSSIRLRVPAICTENYFKRSILMLSQVHNQLFTLSV